MMLWRSSGDATGPRQRVEPGALFDLISRRMALGGQVGQRERKRGSTGSGTGTGAADTWQGMATGMAGIAELSYVTGTRRDL